MASDEKIRNSFQRVKEDIYELNNKVNRTNNSLSNVKENTQEWLLNVMQRQNKIEEQINSVLNKIYALESQMIELKK